MNREIYQYELPWNALQLNSEDIYLSMGVGYVPDEEMLKQLDLLKKEIGLDAASITEKILEDHNDVFADIINDIKVSHKSCFNILIPWP